MKPKTLLIYPSPSLSSPEMSPALSIFYVGAWAEREGFDIDYADLRYDDINRVLNSIKNYDVIGISAMTGHQLEQGCYIATVAKTQGKIVIWGGIHASILPEQLIVDGYADYVIAGEGENPFYKLLQRLESGDKTLHGSVIYGDPININDQIYPVTAKNMNYFQISAQLGHMRLEESRGCAYSCHYCFNSYFYGGKRRQMDLELWEEHFNRLQKETGFKNFNFGDNLGKNLNRIKGIDKILKKHDVKAFINMRCDAIDKKMVDFLKTSNVHSIFFGAESGSDWVLDFILGKRLQVHQIKQCAKLMNETDITTRYSFMAGIPGEMINDVNKTLDLAYWIYRNDKNSGITFFVFTPYPGTKLYNDLVELGDFVPPKHTKDWLNFKRDGGKTPFLNAIYYLSGMAYCDRDGQRTDLNFPGASRILIKPFEWLSKSRLKHGYYDYYNIEKSLIKKLIEWRVNKTIEKEKWVIAVELGVKYVAK